MYDDLDVNKARIFLYYLAKAAREEIEVKEAEIVSAGDRIRSLARRLDKFIHSFLFFTFIKQGKPPLIIKT